MAKEPSTTSGKLMQMAGEEKNPILGLVEAVAAIPAMALLPVDLAANAIGAATEESSDDRKQRIAQEAAVMTKASDLKSATEWATWNGRVLAEAGIDPRV